MMELGCRQNEMNVCVCFIVRMVYVCSEQQVLMSVCISKSIITEPTEGLIVRFYPHMVLFLTISDLPKTSRAQVT
jgi:hypothetical protein